MFPLCRMPLSLLLLTLAVTPLPALPRAKHPAIPAPEQHASAAFTAARAAGAPSLHAFIERMPKGADLHMHLSGAIYAETFLKDAVEDHLCLDPIRQTLVKNIGLTRSLPPQPVCAEGMLAASTAFRDQALYDAMVDAFSMRSFVPSSGISGHDQFFATFARFGGLDKSHTAEWLDEVATRAAAQNEQYLEIMLTPDFAALGTLGNSLGWPTPPIPSSGSDTSTPSPPLGASPAELATLREKLLAGGLRDQAAANRAEVAAYLQQRRELEHCGQPTATPACAVEIRILYQVLRAFPPQRVFAQTLLAFEVASSDPNVVGLNFVQPEDAYLAMSEYHRQMLMLDYLHSVYPKVHITLHAGELAAGLVPPPGLRFHIREAVTARPRRTHRPRRRRHDRNRPPAASQRARRPPHLHRNQPHLQRRHPRRQHQPPLAARLPRRRRPHRLRHRR